MNKLILTILLAGVAITPALAQERDHEAAPQWSGEREHPDRGQHGDGERRDRPPQPQAQPSPQAQPQFVPPPQTAPEVRQQVQTDPRGGLDRSRFGRGDRAPGDVDQQGFGRTERTERGNRGDRGRFTSSVPQPAQQGQPSEWTRNRDGWSRRSEGDLRQGDRRLPNVMRSRNPLIVSSVPREGTQPPPRFDSHRRTANWNGDWRRDNRYDWRGWRGSHGSQFHVGIYYDPFGWNYRPYQVGWRLWPTYYSRNYWIEDPWQYRLPYPPPGTVWVRYWNDAVLVDTWTGQVVDVVHNFFW